MSATEALFQENPEKNEGRPFGFEHHRFRFVYKENPSDDLTAWETKLDFLVTQQCDTKSPPFPKSPLNLARFDTKFGGA